LTKDGPKVLEYNVRFGDPETQAILMRLESDLLAIFEATCRGTLSQLKIEWSPGASACVVLASGGYPGKYKNGIPIEGLQRLVKRNNLEVFHAGTSASPEGKMLTAGGRVLGVTAKAATLDAALTDCYAAVAEISWEGMQYRRDIGRSSNAHKAAN
jgi:phosphoribosylamine--glycine ligase